MDPPPCIQNAMMTKDKKPFTYTPGGIDLSEVRSPRMQRRIERNATLGSSNDVQRPPPPPPNAGPIPPAALAAMRPQPQVQVFPGPPPPPPMQKHIPPPPPPPISPLPTQKVTLQDQVIERPDMTKIIPENPMALLRKTGGPTSRPSMLNESFKEQNDSFQPPRSPQPQVYDQSPTYQPRNEQFSNMAAPVQTNQPHQHQQYRPSTSPQPEYQSTYQSSPIQNQQVPQRSADLPRSVYQPPAVERQTPSDESSSNVGSLYIPPRNQQQQKVITPPTPPDRSQAPATPPLREAPRPWQQRSPQQQQELPPWVKKDADVSSQSPPPATNMQQRWQPNPNTVSSPQIQSASPNQDHSTRTIPVQQKQSAMPPVRIEIRTSGFPMGPMEPEERKPNAVYVTQPIVLQHPGSQIEPPYQVQMRPQPQQQNEKPKPQVQPKPTVNCSGTRIIPIQIERTPTEERNLNQQSSWEQPTQSNSFKVIQRATNAADGDESPVPMTQHSARYTQEMPAQMRKVNSDDNGNFSQGNGQGQRYVHPSEQVVPEPKKYMGGNIPGRTFKILQAMTNSPNINCANAKNYEEPTPNTTINNPNSYPYYPSPYWPNFYTNHDPHEQSESPNIPKNSGSSPLPYKQPFWPDFYQKDHLLQESDSISKMSDRSSKSSTNRSGRSTPLPMPPPMPYPFYGYMPPPPPPPPYVRPRSNTPKYDSRPQTPAHKVKEEDPPYMYHMYPPYFDPYYYGYYYGYMPMIPPYPYYPQTSENEEYSGYSSMDEMSCYDANNGRLRKRNSFDNSTNSVQSLTQSFESRSKSTAPSITITPTDSTEFIFSQPLERKKDEVSVYREMSPNSETYVEADLKNNRLQSIKSVSNINVYDRESDEHTDSSDSEDSSDDEEQEVSVQESDTNQLSVIYEESERGFSRATHRSDSSCSEVTIADNQNGEDEDFLSRQNVKYKIKLFQESVETLSMEPIGEKQMQKMKKESVDDSTFKNNHNKIRIDTITNNFGNTIEDQNLPTNHLWSKQQNIKSPDHFEHQKQKYDCEWTETENDSNLKQNVKEEEQCILYDGCDPNTNQTQEDLEAPEQIAKNKYLINIDSDKMKSQQRIEIFGEIKEKVGYFRHSNYKDEAIDNGLSDKYHVIQNFENNDTSSNASSTIIEAEDETVYFKLGKKRDVAMVMKERPEEAEMSDKAVLNSTSSKDELQQDSVYDVLATSIDDNGSTLTSGGILMRVDSFATQLEDIKRNSGLWSFTLDASHREQSIINEDSDKETEEEVDEAEQGEEEQKEKVLYQQSTSESIVVDSSDDEETEETLHKVDIHVDQLLQDDVENRDDNNSESSQDIDFWSQIKTDDDDFTPRRRSFFLEDESKEDAEHVVQKEEKEIHIQNRHQISNKFEKDTDSTCSKDSSSSESRGNHSPNTFQPEYIEQNEKITESLNISYNHEVTYNSNLSNAEEATHIDACASIDPEIKPQSIKERIEALNNDMSRRQQNKCEKEEIMCGKRHLIMEVPNGSKNTSTKSSLKSFEEYSEEEELDSGVISDISRHISDNEEFPELRKLTRYERAATHSRLFKLLQDECDIEQNQMSESIQKEDKFSKLSVRRNRRNDEVVNSKSTLSLPLNELYEMNSTNVNEKLVEELVESLLRSKKAQVFKNMSKQKLHAAAATILQEGTDISPEEFSGLISPLRGETGCSTAAQTPQEFYGDENEYKQYYDSWREAAVEIIPSKAFKLLQDHLESQKLGSIDGFLAKCPRILSSKNIPQEIMKIINNSGSDCSTNLSLDIPQSNDVANT